MGSAIGPVHYVGQRVPDILPSVSRGLCVPRVHVSVCPISIVHISICCNATVHIVHTMRVTHPTIYIVHSIQAVHPLIHTWQIVHSLIRVIYVSFSTVKITVSKSIVHIIRATIYIHYVISVIGSCVQWRAPEVGTVAAQGHPRGRRKAGGSKGEAGRLAPS